MLVLLQHAVRLDDVIELKALCDDGLQLAL